MPVISHEHNYAKVCKSFILLIMTMYITITECLKSAGLEICQGKKNNSALSFQTPVGQREFLQSPALIIFLRFVPVMQNLKDLASLCSNYSQLHAPKHDYLHMAQFQNCCWRDM